MTAGTNRPAIIQVLDDIAQWRSQRDEEHGAAVAAIEAEEAEAKRAIEEAQRRLAGLAEKRVSLEGARGDAAVEGDRRERVALREGLQVDRELLETRAAQMRAQVDARRAELEARLAEPEIATAIEEYERFAEVEASLAALPPSYRQAIVAHHDGVRAKIDPILAAVNAGPPALGLDEAGICVLFAVDPPEGAPEALVAVLPVAWAVYRDWAERGEDLAAQLAYRVVAAVSRVLIAVEASEAPVQYLEVNGCLAIQVWLGDVEVKGELRERMLEEIEALREDAAELNAAGVALYGLWVRPSLLVDEEGA
jgi:hypothetical protein